VSRQISRRPPAENNFGLAAVDFAKPPAAGRKTLQKFTVIYPTYDIVVRLYAYQKLALRYSLIVRK